MSAPLLRMLRYAVPVAATGTGIVTVFMSENSPEADKENRRSTLLPMIPTLLSSSRVSDHTLMESATAYEHDPADFDYYVKIPTADDLPVLLHKFDSLQQEVWPWIWTHPNDNGPHHVFVGDKLAQELLKKIKLLRDESPQNNILLLLSSDEEEPTVQGLKQEEVASILDKCHCGVVTGVKLELLNAEHKILMLDDERVVAFDYLTIF